MPTADYDAPDDNDAGVPMSVSKGQITCAHDGTYHGWDPDSGACPDPREFNLRTRVIPPERGVS